MKVDELGVFENGWNMDFDMLFDDHEYYRTGCYGDR